MTYVSFVKDWNDFGKGQLWLHISHRPKKQVITKYMNNLKCWPTVYGTFSHSSQSYSHICRSMFVWNHAAIPSFTGMFSSVCRPSVFRWWHAAGEWKKNNIFSVCHHVFIAFLSATILPLPLFSFLYTINLFHLAPAFLFFFILLPIYHASPLSRCLVSGPLPLPVGDRKPSLWLNFNDPSAHLGSAVSINRD